MRFSLGNRQSQPAKSRSPNRFMRFAIGMSDFVESYHEVRREAYRRHPESFR